MTLPISTLHDAGRTRRAIPRPRSQRGVTLLFALITLVALLLATLALIRSVDTSTVLMGNIGFKQDATASADQATRQAIAWLKANNTVLNTDKATEGYYASTQEVRSDGTAKAPVDATGQQLAGTSARQLVDWAGDACASMSSFAYCDIKPVAAAAVSGNPNRASYVVFRLCSQPGDFTSATYTGTCAKPLKSSVSTASVRGSIDYTNPFRLTGGSGPYYRVVVRVQGARNTTSYTETIVHF
jgi:Tfp pilus assembly protein PilV